MTRKTTPTHVLLNQIELNTNASSITFSNIPQGYGDLFLTVNGYLNVGAGNEVDLNGDTNSNNYNWVAMDGIGSGSGSSYVVANNRGIFVMGENSSSTKIHFLDYSASDKHKTILAKSDFWGNTEQYVQARVLRWSNNSPITSIKLSEINANRTFEIGTVFSLYGVYA